MQGDGAWEPKAGERGTPAVAHGTHQNQYTKRKALLTASGNNTSSNNDSDGNVGSSEDNRDHQHGVSADTGFAAEPSGRGSKESQGEGTGIDAALKDEEEKSGRLSRLQGRASGNRPDHRAGRPGRMRGSSNLKAAEAVDTREESNALDNDAEEQADIKATLASGSLNPDVATASHGPRVRADAKADAARSRQTAGASAAHPDRHTENEADVAKPSSAVKDEAQTSSADENAGNHSNNAGAAVQASGRPAKCSSKGSGAAGKTAPADAAELKQTAADDTKEAVSLSGETLAPV